MKLSLALFIAASVAMPSMAFTPVQTSRLSGFVLRGSPTDLEEKVENTVESSTPPIEDTTNPPTRTKPTAAKQSIALPFMNRPAMLDGTMAGDVGFDPFGFASSPDKLLQYREAEVKHGRLAMLAAVGWPLSELFDRPIAQAFNAPVIVDATDKAPSILNGGLDRISPVYWIAVLAMAAAIDLFGIRKSKSNDPAYFPGNLGFDPLGLYPRDDTNSQFQRQVAEIKHGRLAMLAITGFALSEFATGLGVVESTPVFFKPLGTVLLEYTNSGYFQP